jgi:ankyrin repeat protein
MLIDSKFRLNELDNNGFSALILASSFKNQNEICLKLLKAGADVNIVSKNGESCLSQAMTNHNKALAKIALKFSAKVLCGQDDLKDHSPFIKAINQQSIWAIEMFCDHGADPNTLLIHGRNVLLHSAKQGLNEICMYLFLRIKDID